MDALSLIAVTAGAVLVVALVLHVWYAIGLSRVFAARGSEPWRAWVPLVNEAEVFRLGRLDPVRAVLLVVPFVNVYGLVLKATAAHRLGAAEGRGAGTTALAVVLPPVWAGVLARDSHDAGAAVAAPGTTMVVDEAPAAESPAVADSPIAEVPGVPAEPASAAAAAGRRSAPTTPAEPFAVPVLPGPREIGGATAAADDGGRAEPITADGVEIEAQTEGAPATRRSPTPPSETVTRGLVASPALHEATPDEVAALGRVGETTDATAERSADRPADAPVAAAPVDESTQTARPRRRRGEWSLALPDGRTATLTGRTVILGRKPSNADESVQYVAVADDTRTMSKEHARLDWTVTGWSITDLDSTNGVTLVHDDGRTERLSAGGTAAVPSRFRLGDANLELRPASTG